jgi:hypothetical protein
MVVMSEVGDVAQAFLPAGSDDFPVASFATGTGRGGPVNRQTGMSALPDGPAPFGHENLFSSPHFHIPGRKPLLRGAIKIIQKLRVLKEVQIAISHRLMVINIRKVHKLNKNF